ncbi:hypothetical protein D3C85_413850 [compost metagenome]
MDVRQIDACVAAIDLSAGAVRGILLGLRKPDERAEVDLGGGRRPGVVAPDRDGAGVLVELACVRRFHLVAAARAAHPKAAFVRLAAQFPKTLPHRTQLGIQQHDRSGLAHRHGIRTASFHFLPEFRHGPPLRLERCLLSGLYRSPLRGRQRSGGSPRPRTETCRNQGGSGNALRRQAGGHGRKGPRHEERRFKGHTASWLAHDFLHSIQNTISNCTSGNRNFRRGYGPFVAPCFGVRQAKSPTKPGRYDVAGSERPGRITRAKTGGAGSAQETSARPAQAKASKRYSEKQQM